jgi:hypothetical protein
MNMTSQDSGQEVINMPPPPHFASYAENQMQYPLNQELDLVTLMKRVRCKHPPVTFGQAECLEEGKCYNRRYLYSIYAHRCAYPFTFDVFIGNYTED